jgi:hypothetical protein
MGEAGGGLTGRWPRKILHGTAGDVSPPAFAALVCMRFPEYASFSVLRETPMPFSHHYFKKLKCYDISYFTGKGVS